MQALKMHLRDLTQAGRTAAAAFRVGPSTNVPPPPPHDFHAHEPGVQRP